MDLLTTKMSTDADKTASPVHSSTPKQDIHKKRKRRVLADVDQNSPDKVTSKNAKKSEDKKKGRKKQKENANVEAYHNAAVEYFAQEAKENQRFTASKSRPTKGTNGNPATATTTNTTTTTTTTAAAAAAAAAITWPTQCNTSPQKFQLSNKCHSINTLHILLCHININNNTNYHDLRPSSKKQQKKQPQHKQASQLLNMSPLASSYMDPSLPSAICNVVHVVEDNLHLEVPVSLDLTDLDESESSFIDDNHECDGIYG